MSNNNVIGLSGGTSLEAGYIYATPYVNTKKYKETQSWSQIPC